jgi:hypothetical protein
VAPVHQHTDGTIHALSSDGVKRYVVTLGDQPSCTCIAGQNGRRCYHLATAQARFGAFFTAPWAVIVPVPDPEPPTPAAPAVCACALSGDDPACACQQQVA